MQSALSVPKAEAIATVQVHASAKGCASPQPEQPTDDHIFTIVPPRLPDALDTCPPARGPAAPTPPGRAASPAVPPADLIARLQLHLQLLGSLECLNTKHTPTSARDTPEDTTSPLTGSCADSSTGAAPSSPTEVIRHHSRSPTGIDTRANIAISREPSTEALAAALQQMALCGQLSPASGDGRPFGGGGEVLHAGQAGWGAVADGTAAHGFTLPSEQVGYAPPAALHIPFYHHHQQQHFLGGPSHLAHLCPADVAMPGALFPPQAFAGPLGDGISTQMLAAFHALQLEQLVAQQQLAMMLAHHPAAAAPVFEECLVGPEGAYQPYCCQVITEEINSAALRMLSQLKALQAADPPSPNFMLNKRYFCSLKEVSKVVGFAKMLLVAPDVRASATANIKPVRLLAAVLAAADAAGVPVIFVLSRRGIGQVFGRDKSMSIVAVMHLGQVEAEYAECLKGAARGRELYRVHGCGQQSRGY